MVQFPSPLKMVSLATRSVPGSVADPLSSIHSVRSVRSALAAGLSVCCGEVDAGLQRLVGGHQHPQALGAFDCHLQRRLGCGRNPEPAVIAMLVAQTQVIGVADRPVRQGDKGRVAHRGHVHVDFGAQEQRHDHADA